MRPRLPGPVTSCVPERRQDLVTGQWVVIADGRHERPHESTGLPNNSDAVLSSCAFCAGHETETTPTVVQFAAPPSSKHGHPWQVRVVDNLYPAFVTSHGGGLEHANGAVCSETARLPSIGMHQVIIECPAHRRHLTELSDAEIEVVLHSYRDRLRAAQLAGEFAYGLIFKNSGRDAGMSREHVHSQFVCLPAIPPLAWTEVEGSRRFYQQRQRCIFCHLGDQALSEGNRLLWEGRAFLAYCPFASRLPYEMWIQPKRHEASLTDASDSSLQELASFLRELLRRMESLLGRVAYNYLIQSRPFDSAHNDHYHWHIVILPRTSRLAGLEWGTGLLVNTVAPERAARELRELALV